MNFFDLGVMQTSTIVISWPYQPKLEHDVSMANIWENGKDYVKEQNAWFDNMQIIQEVL